MSRSLVRALRRDLRSCHACGRLVRIYVPRSNPDGDPIMVKHRRVPRSEARPLRPGDPICDGSYEPREWRP